MGQNYRDIGDYFKDLSDRHPDIKAFCRFELDELLDKTVSIPAFPALVLEGFDFDYAGSQADNVLKSRNGAFCVVEICDGLDAEKRMKALDRVELIAEQVLMKMVNDKRNRHELLTTFDIGTAEGVHFLNPALRYAFCRISFSFKTKIREDLTVWSL